MGPIAAARILGLATLAALSLSGFGSCASSTRPSSTTGIEGVQTADEPLLPAINFRSPEVIEMVNNLNPALFSEKRVRTAIETGEPKDVLGSIQIECPICLEHISSNNFVMRKCGHAVHTECYESYKKRASVAANQCELCRNDQPLLTEKTGLQSALEFFERKGWIAQTEQTPVGPSADKVDTAINLLNDYFSAAETVMNTIADFTASKNVTIMLQKSMNHFREGRCTPGTWVWMYTTSSAYLYQFSEEFLRHAMDSWGRVYLLFERFGFPDQVMQQAATAGIPVKSTSRGRRAAARVLNAMDRRRPKELVVSEYVSKYFQQEMDVVYSVAKKLAPSAAIPDLPPKSSFGTTVEISRWLRSATPTLMSTLRNMANESLLKTRTSGGNAKLVDNEDWEYRVANLNQLVAKLVQTFADLDCRINNEDYKEAWTAANGHLFAARTQA